MDWMGWIDGWLIRSERGSLLGHVIPIKNSFFMYAFTFNFSFIGFGYIIII